MYNLFLLFKTIKFIVQKLEYFMNLVGIYIMVKAIKIIHFIYLLALGIQCIANLF